MPIDDAEEEIDERELAIMRDLAGKCGCGWQLPLSVIAYPKGTTQTGDHSTEIPGSMVGLVCPMCGRGHGFMTSTDRAPA